MGTDVEPPGAVLGVSPKGFASTGDPIYLTFSTPMDPATSQLQFELEPWVAGTTTWTSPTRVAFQPTHSLLRASVYTVHVSGQAKTRGEHAVDIDERWSFETPRPTAQISSDYAEYDDEERARVSWKSGFTIELSDPASARKVRSALTVVREDHERARPLGFVLKPNDDRPGEPTAESWRVLPRGHWPADATIRATLDGTLTTGVGTLPIGTEAFATLRTRPGFKLEVECDDSATDGCVVGEFQLSFDAPLPESARGKIRVSPKPRDFESYPIISRGDDTFSTIMFFGEFKVGQTYTVRLGESIRDVTGQTLAGASSRAITFVAPPPILELEGTGTQLTGRKGTFGVESRSVEDARVLLSTLSNAALAEIVNQPSDAQFLPRNGVQTRELELDLSPGGTWGWDARDFSLAKELGGPTGAAFVQVIPGSIVPGQGHRATVEESGGLIQFTNLGLLVGDSPAGGFVRVLTLSQAQPVAGATAHIYSSDVPPKLVGSFGPSDANGFIRTPSELRLATNAVVVQTDDDRVALGLQGSGLGSWRSYALPSVGAEFDIGVVMTDRGLYQPGERMRVMGWVARSSTENAAGIEGSGTRPVLVRLLGDGDEVLAETTVRTKTYGKFWATLDIPERTKLGSARVEATVKGHGGGTFSREIDLREFVAPAYDVALSIRKAELQHGEGTHVSAMARYLHGMPLPVAEANLQTHCSARSYRPVNADGFSVAAPVTVASSPGLSTSALPGTKEHLKGRVDFDVEFPGLSVGHFYTCAITLRTMDAARQELATTTSAKVHPSKYLLVENDESQGQVGVPRTVQVRAVLPSGAATTAKAGKMIVTRTHGDDPPKTVHSCALQFDPDGLASCTWTPRERGNHRVTFIGGVDGVKLSHAQNAWIYMPPTEPSKKVRFGVQVPARSAVGQNLDVEVQTQTPQATGVLVEVHAGIRATHPFATQDHLTTLHLTPDQTWVPSGYVDVLVAHPDGSRLPYIERSSHEVQLGYESRALTVALENPEVASIGSTLPIDVTVTDPDGRAVADAHVSLWAVDEGILMLRDWSFPAFTRELAVDRGNEAAYFHSYDDLRHPYRLRDDPFEPGSAGFGLGGLSGYGRGSGSGGAHGSSRSARTRPTTRRNFDPAPIFIGDIKTGADGTARVHGLLPDTLTTFRIAAVATAEVAGTGAFSRAGRKESKVRVTQDLAVRPVLPRILRPGDQAQLGVLVDNLTDAPGLLQVEVMLKTAKGIARLTSESKITQRLQGSQARIPVSVEAEGPGEMLVWVSATLTTDDGRVLRDASELPLEVRAERTLVRHAAAYGSMSDTQTAAVALDVPSEHIPDSALASVELYASMLAGYRDAAVNLVTYPYGCVEQTASRLVPLAALHGLQSHDLGVQDVTAFVEVGLDRLAKMQTRDGGFAYWPGGDRAHVYGTAYATWALTELKRSGIEVDEKLLHSAVAFLDAELAEFRTYATPTADDDVKATMALLATASQGRPNKAVLDALLMRTETLPAFAHALLLMAVHAANANDPRIPALLGGLHDRVELRDSTARSKAASRSFSEFFDSPIRTDAMILLALVRTSSDDPLIDPLARGLTEARNQGQLRNTQENAYALLAMSGYAALREAVEPEMDVRAWVGPELVLDAEFQGHDLSLQHESAAIRGERPRVTLQRLGEGRLYYRVGMQWAPTPGSITPQARGISIQRVLYDTRGALEGRSLVAGEAGTLEVVITTDARQRYVAIEVPIPAGIEAVDRTLGRGGASQSVGTATGGPALPDSHQELRGDRVLVFVDRLPAGTHRYRVPVRATHEGLYSMPPATAHGMYSPEVSGNTEAREVRVVSPEPPDLRYPPAK